MGAFFVWGIAMYDEDNPEHVSRCRILNDDLRNSMGQHDNKNMVMLTTGLRSRGDEFVARTLTAVREFTDFNEDNDPYLEHDVVIVTVDSQKVMAKIDYYDNDLKFHSPDKADPAVTKRVLTIMLMSEY